MPLQPGENQDSCDPHFRRAYLVTTIDKENRRYIDGEAGLDHVQISGRGQNQSPGGLLCSAAFEPVISSFDSGSVALCHCEGSVQALDQEIFLSLKLLRLWARSKTGHCTRRLQSGSEQPMCSFGLCEVSHKGHMWPLRFTRSAFFINAIIETSAIGILREAWKPSRFAVLMVLTTFIAAGKN